MDDLQRLLEDLHRSGRADSSGVFTLDAGHALEKLRRFKLVEPEMFPLRLVAAATRGKAENIRIQSAPGSFSLEDDARPLSLEELRSLLGVVPGQHPEPQINELSLGLHAALGLRPAPSITVQSWMGAVGAELVLRGDQAHLRKLTVSPWDWRSNSDRTCNRVVVGQELSAWTRMCRAFRGGDGVTALVRGRCGLSCYPRVAVNGGQSGVSQLLTNPGVGYSALWGTEMRQFPWRPPHLLREATIPEPYTALLAWPYWDGRPGTDLVANFIVDGVTYTEEVTAPRAPTHFTGFEPGPPPVWAVVYAAPVSLDLSRRALVQDEAFETVLGALLQEAEHLRRAAAYAQTRQAEERALLTHPRTRPPTLPD